MILSGVLANTGAVLAGGIVGLLFKKGIPDKIRKTILAGLGLCVLATGITGVADGGNLLICALSIAIGGALGEWIDFEEKLSRLGNALSARFASSGDQRFGEAFIASTLFTCVGAMAIVGAIDSGMRGQFDTYYAKALVDGVFIFIMTTTLGTGCIFSALPLFVYQAILTIAAGALASLLSAAVIAEIAFVGAVVVMAIGLNMLGLTKIKIGNLILAPFLPILLSVFL